ncbi:hypothetical protein D3P09_20425 [Paenibacillus pinisoli]|uniref:Uncharacterized protein n=1 Tax=Paenibacillus pinisoli TaxID=1276110 RepID=A0A3A6PFH6_9BACL|nr:hypothetical protein [Paenibacillus pinisoli]RJX38416.1 hypothetical protein D3P09_20425 [Paenibacillus pinisoli]
MFRFLLKRRDRAEWVRLSDQINGFMVKAVIALLLLIAVFQVAMQNDTVRGMLTSADRWEGTRLN